MADDIQVRTVRVEFLRAGPAHNQLLSPLTPYLAVCDDAEAGVVQVPFEQHVFERRMRALRHQDQSDQRGERPAMADRLPDLREMGVAMARLLGSVPRFPGSLAADPNGRDTVVRVSLTITASELAGLPFELAKVPIGPDAFSEAWLSVQTKVPVVITRRTRNVSQTSITWLQSPRVLFIAASSDDEVVPYTPHLKALTEAVKPFTMSPRFGQRAKLHTTPAADGLNVRSTYGDMLTVLSHATLDGVARECALHRYTHVHVLAHGAQDTTLGDTSYGLILREEDGVISGERLASALNGVIDDQLHSPQVVTLATCDSGAVRDVVNPGASLAHALHQSGIPLVIGSQVPLGFDGSVLFTQQFYEGLLWGEHPWVLMHRVRTTLHGRLKPVDHDWAALVVYESLPSDMTAALEHATYQQCQRAIEVAYSSGRWVGGERMTQVIDRLAEHGRTYAMEARALRAAALMINARDELYDIEQHPKARTEAQLRESLHYRRWCLEQALADNSQAVTGFLVSDGQGLSAPYRALLSKLSIQLVLGEPVDWTEWEMARHWAEITARESESGEARGWAQACLCELWLLRTLDAQGPGDTVCLQRATRALRETSQRRQPLDRVAGTTAYWLEHRLSSYTDAWIRPDLRELARETDETPDTPPTDLTPLKPAAERLLKILRDQNGLPDRPPGSLTSAGESRRKLPSRPKPSLAMKTGTPPDAAQPASDAAAAAPAAADTAAAKPGSGGRLLSAGSPAPSSRAGAPAAQAATRATGKKPPKPPPRPSAPPGGTPSPITDPFFDIEMLPVDQGDSLWVEWGSRKGPRWRLLVDCGTEASFKRALGPRIGRQPAEGQQRHFELFILSHIDGDHVGGGIPLLQQARKLGVSFGDIWFNGRHHLERVNMLSGKDGDDFSTLLKREQMPWNLWTEGKAIVRPQGDEPAETALPTYPLPGGMTLRLMSPTPSTLTQLAGTWDEDLAAPGKRRQLGGGRQFETRDDLDAIVRNPFNPDDSRPNGSSIAVLLEFAGKRVLLGADAYADVLASAIKRLLPAGQQRLPLDFFKLPHHGSRGNLNDGLMALIDCGHYGISTSGAVFAHPDREALARAVRRSARPATLWFNYPVPQANRAYHAIWQDTAFQKKWGFQARYPQAGQAGQLLQMFPAG